MKKIFITGLLLLASTSIFAQMTVNKQIQMNGATADDKRITGVSNASAVTPASTDAMNIATFQSNYTNYGAGAFALGTYSLTLIPTPAQYWEGMIVSFKASAINTGATSLNINSLGARTIVKAGGQALVAGDIQANQMVTVVYNLTGTKFEVIGSMGIDGWKLRGNASTNPANDFLGTTDAQDLVLRTTNVERMRITSAGQVSINNANANTGITPLQVQNNDGNYSIRGASTTSSILGTSSSTGVAFALWGVIAGNAGAGIAGRSGGGLSSYLPNTGGSFSSASGVGVYGTTGSTTGTGGVFSGQTVATISTLTNGSGSASTGTDTGVYGMASGTGNNKWGGIFDTGNASNQTFVGGRTAGTDYKINGPGTVSTMVKDTKNEYVNMFCAESPEILFQDYGTGKLTNGKAYISIDAIFAKNIHISAERPMKVFIQLEGECNGVYVANKTKEGFEVIELQKGKSNASFSWTIVANRADTYNANGTLDSKFQDVRFPKSPKKLETKEQKSETKEVKID